MFEDSRSEASIASIDNFQRGQAATACLVRMARLVDDSRVLSEFPRIAQLVKEIEDYSVSRSAGIQVEIDYRALSSRVREFLGPVDDPHEELPGIGAWVMDIVSLADCVLGVWEGGSSTSEECFEAMVSSYSLASRIEDESEDSEVSALGDLEFQKQLDDVRRMKEGSPWGQVLQESRSIADDYLGWLRKVPVS
ncbi:hypothetical protein [Streptomyces sp. NPDC085479]|uniref:hypothetical protein n=1 Tax=Streptomyces sp. NPDC085479 TaxID=3365726 RepID=UPI0037D6F5BD